MPLKYDNHLLGLVKVPRHSHPWADDVMSDCVPNCLFAMITSCPSAANWFLDQALALGPHGAITSRDASCPLGPRGIRTSDQRSNQAQEFLFLWPAASRDKKGSNLNIGDLAT